MNKQELEKLFTTDNNALLVELDIIAENVHMAMSGLQHDGSWIRPKRINKKQQYECLLEALARINRIRKANNTI